MKIRLTAVFVIVSAACALFSDGMFAKPRGRMLVLGFRSSQLNDVQDRLLRETVMRRLYTEGYQIVPVMEIESVFSEDRKGRIRKLSRDDVRTICTDLVAGYALFGSISPMDGRQDGGIAEGRNYDCRLVLYLKDSDRFTEVKLTLPGGKNLYEFYNALSEQGVREIVKLL